MSQSCVLVLSSSHESQRSCHLCQYYHQATSQWSCHSHVSQYYQQATRDSCHVMCVSTITKSRELAFMSRVLVLSSSHESQRSCHVCQYYHQATRVSGNVMCVSTIIKPRELAIMSCVLVLSSSHESSCHVMCVSTIIKPRELAVMSCVLVLSSSHESQWSCHVCQYRSYLCFYTFPVVFQNESDGVLFCYIIFINISHNSIQFVILVKCGIHYMQPEIFMGFVSN